MLPDSMLWNKRKPGEPSRADLARSEQASEKTSGCREADTDRALDTLGTLLKTYGRLAFDTDQAAVEIRARCDAWAQRIVLGEARRQNGTEGEAHVRDWPGLQRFFDAQRKEEGEYVNRSLGSLRQSVFSLARCLSGSVGEDRDSDARVERGLQVLSRALVNGDVAGITDAASAVIETARDSFAQRRQREARQLIALGQELQQLRQELSEQCKLAASDEATGFFVRAALEQQLEQLAGIGMLLEQRPWLILIDVDVDAGDAAPPDARLLGEVSKSVSRTFLRKQDFIARSGAKQVAVLLVDITEEQTIAASQRLLKDVRKLTAPRSLWKRGAVTVSVGIAQLRTNETASRWAARAGVALARAQEDGGDGYELSPG